MEQGKDYRSYHNILSTVDLCFGVMCLATFLLVAFSSLHGPGHYNLLWVMGSFIGVNIVISETTRRLLQQPSLGLEIFRLGVVNQCLSAAGYIFAQPPFQYFWFIYLISALACPALTLGVDGRRSKVGVGLTGLTLVNYSVCAYFYGPRDSHSYILPLMVLVAVGATLLVILDQLNRSLQANLKSEQLLEVQRAQMVTSSKLSALGEMAGGVAHEINTPLSVIIWRAAALRERLQIQGDKEPAQTVASLEKIEKTGLRISQIVKALLTFARESEKAPVARIPVRTVVQGALDLCAERLRKHSISLVLSPSLEELPESLGLECRMGQIAQVILNLVNNAYDAVEASENAWVRLEVQVNGAGVEISVTDSGPGIPVELRQKIFQPFFTTKPIGKGPGLGLSVSTGIIVAHGGGLSLDEKCENTRFLIQLPTVQIAARAGLSSAS